MTVPGFTRLDLPIEKYAAVLTVKMWREEARRLRWQQWEVLGIDRRARLERWVARRFLRRLERDGGHAVDEVKLEFSDRHGDYFLRNEGQYRMTVRAITGWPVDEPWRGIRVGSGQSMLSVMVPVARPRTKYVRGMEADGFPLHGRILDEQDAQDYRDGEALRLLREAMPGGDTITIARWGPAWRIIVSTSIDTIEGARLGKVAPTIAEAADACREAIGRALEGSG